MHVRKFEADTLEEALKNIKRELGPDAIILKTITNKGFKGAFKKKKIEITAAISEKSYSKKANVDKSLGANYQEKFYDNNSNFISNMIDNHSENRKINMGYGQLGLNKAVVGARDLTHKIKNGLDDFLNFGNEENHENTTQDVDEAIADVTEYVPAKKYQDKSPINERANQEFTNEHQYINTDNDELMHYKNKIDMLEKQVYQLIKKVERVQKKEPLGVYQLRTTLKSLDINDHFIEDITRKALFELSEEDTQNGDIVFDFALREMLLRVKTDIPLFSKVEAQNSGTITILLSETTAGQSSMLYKIGALKADSILIRNNRNSQSIDEKNETFVHSMFGLNVIDVNSIAEIVSECRKAIELGKNVFVDFKNTESDIDQTKKFIDGLKRAFQNVEVLICLSAIHSELYNKKMILRYRGMIQGIVVNQLDLCLNYGSLFNISDEVPNLPYKFYGTGEVVPDDLEAATAERILAGIFGLD